MIKINVYIRLQVSAFMGSKFYSSNTCPVHQVACRALSTNVSTSMAYMVEPLNASRDLHEKEIDAIKLEKDDYQIENELVKQIIETRQPQPKKDPLIRDAKIGAPPCGFVDDIFLKFVASKGNLLAKRELERRQREE